MQYKFWNFFALKLTIEKGNENYKNPTNWIKIQIFKNKNTGNKTNKSHFFTAKAKQK